MPKYKIYLDSNVFISYARQELGKGFRQLGEDSGAFFALCSKMGLTVVLSDLFFAEVEKACGLGSHDVAETLREFGVKTETMTGKCGESELAAFLRQGMHHADAVHARAAVVSKTSCIVTWNKKDFENAAGCVKAVTPEEFISGSFQ